MTIFSSWKRNGRSPIPKRHHSNSQQASGSTQDNLHCGALQEDRGRSEYLPSFPGMCNYLSMKPPGLKVSLNILAPPVSGVITITDQSHWRKNTMLCYNVHRGKAGDDPQIINRLIISQSLQTAKVKSGGGHFQRNHFSIFQPNYQFTQGWNLRI